MLCAYKNANQNNNKKTTLNYNFNLKLCNTCIFIVYLFYIQKQRNMVYDMENAFHLVQCIFILVFCFHIALFLQQHCINLFQTILFVFCFVKKKKKIFNLKQMNGIIKDHFII